MTVDFNGRHLTPKFCHLYMWPGSFHFSKGAIGLQRQWQENHAFYLTVGLKGWGTYLQQRVQPSMVLEPFPLWRFPFQDSGLPESLAVPPKSSKASACPTQAASLQWHLGEGAQSVPPRATSSVLEQSSPAGQGVPPPRRDRRGRDTMDARQAGHTGCHRIITVVIPTASNFSILDR